MPQSVPKELAAASTRPLVLAILARGQNYGYAILKEVARLSAGTLDWQEGMLYPVLHRLERDGLVEANWRSADGRRRKYYALTDRGRLALTAERGAWARVQATLNLAWEGTG
jgi:DNA-binding PadR family transcriptional regulator